MNKYSFSELREKYGWKEQGPGTTDLRIKFAYARGVAIELLDEKRGNAKLFKVVEEFEVYSREDIIKKFNLQTAMKNHDSAALIKYCELRGIIIEKVTSKNESFFRVIEDNRTLENEEWRFLEQEHLYVSNLGRAKNLSHKILDVAPGTQGYVTIHGMENNKYYRLHRLVMKAFSPIENDEEFDVDHINGIRDDNRLENLRWVTAKRNIKNRDENQNLIGNLVADYIQEYGYDEVYKRIINLFN